MLSGKTPYRGRNIYQVKRNVLNSKSHLRFPNYFSNDAKLLLSDLLQKGHDDCNRRLGAGPDGTEDVKDADLIQ